MVFKFLLLAALLATFTTVQAAPWCKCGNKIYHYSKVHAAIRKAGVFESNPSLERPAYPRRFVNRKGRLSFSELCPGVAGEQLYEFPLRKGYHPGSHVGARQTAGIDRIIYNHSNGNFCGCVSVRVQGGKQLCTIIDGTAETSKKNAGSSSGKAAGSSVADSAAGSAAGSSA